MVSGWRFLVISLPSITFASHLGILHEQSQEMHTRRTWQIVFSVFRCARARLMNEPRGLAEMESRVWVLRGSKPSLVWGQMKGWKVPFNFRMGNCNYAERVLVHCRQCGFLPRHRPLIYLVYQWKRPFLNSSLNMTPLCWFSKEFLAYWCIVPMIRMSSRRNHCQTWTIFIKTYAQVQAQVWDESKTACTNLL